MANQKSTALTAASAPIEQAVLGAAFALLYSDSGKGAKVPLGWNARYVHTAGCPMSRAFCETWEPFPQPLFSPIITARSARLIRV